MKVHYIFYVLALLVGAGVFFTEGFEQLFAGGFAAAFIAAGLLAKLLLSPEPNTTIDEQ